MAAHPSRLPQVLDLDALVQPVAQVRRFGETFDILPIDGVSQALFAQLVARNAEGETIPIPEQMALTTRVLEQTVPGMSAEQRERLTIAERVDIIALSGTQLDHVRDFIAQVEDGARLGNGAAPAPRRKGRASAPSR